MGSPPPAWGKLSHSARIPKPVRFTPTRVGKAPGVEVFPDQCRVHPHPRGESMPVVIPKPFPFGSPPPAWGKRNRTLVEQRFHRFTPNRVGKASGCGGNRHLLANSLSLTGYGGTGTATTTRTRSRSRKAQTRPCPSSSGRSHWTGPQGRAGRRGTLDRWAKGRL